MEVKLLWNLETKKSKEKEQDTGSLYKKMNWYCKFANLCNHYEMP